LCCDDEGGDGEVIDQLTRGDEVRQDDGAAGRRASTLHTPHQLLCRRTQECRRARRQAAEVVRQLLVEQHVEERDHRAERRRPEGGRYANDELVADNLELAFHYLMPPADREERTMFVAIVESEARGAGALQVIVALLAAAS